MKVCSLIFAPLLDDADDAMIAALTDRFVQGILLDSPDQAVSWYGLSTSDVVMQDSSGKLVENAAGDDAEGDVLVYFLPLDGQYQLDVSSGIPFSIGVYQAGSDDTNRETFRHDVSTSTSLAASMDINSSSSFDLEIDSDNDGVVDQTLSVQPVTLDVVKPEITGLSPVQWGSIQASYADNPGGAGIDAGAAGTWWMGLISPPRQMCSPLRCPCPWLVSKPGSTVSSCWSATWTETVFLLRSPSYHLQGWHYLHLSPRW